jgi:hypothetical protein
LNKRVPGRSGFALAGWAQQADAELGQRGFELAAVRVPVRNQRLVDLPAQVGVVEQGVPFVGLGSGEREADRQPVHGGEPLRARVIAGRGLAHAVSWVAGQGARSAYPTYVGVPLLVERTSVGLDVHARSLVAATSTRKFSRSSTDEPPHTMTERHLLLGCASQQRSAHHGGAT